jgi:hypothetical protein
MDWMTWLWTWWPTWDVAPVAVGSTRPSVEDVWLIEVVYGFIALESCCESCGARLGARVELAPGCGEGAEWALTVVVRCRGWRRHSHRAVVAERAGDLVLGSLER